MSMILLVVVPPLLVQLHTANDIMKGKGRLVKFDALCI